jgi:hypothetical protein
MEQVTVRLLMFLPSVLLEFEKIKEMEKATGLLLMVLPSVVLALEMEIEPLVLALACLTLQLQKTEDMQAMHLTGLDWVLRKYPVLVWPLLAVLWIVLPWMVLLKSVLRALDLVLSGDSSSFHRSRSPTVQLAQHQWASQD